MQGYRTILFTVLMASVGMLGVKINPDLMNHWLDVFCAVWAIGAILLRVITTTPIGAKVNTEIAALTERVHFLISRGPSAGDITELAGAVRDLFGKLESDPQLSSQGIETIKRLETLLDTLQAVVPVAAQVATPALSPAALESVATPAVEAAVSAIAGDGSVPPSQGSSAQPSARNVALTALARELDARILAPILPAL